ncbi:pentatricopeptide repeat-containing protein 2, mitochondrial [Anabrus simplex]|uniref:pentatricopeptide repeat-containing protein 2, mitochondrial n=1 Tax=Anabrus simplex TaxID=316456 RepID=UPI0034DCEE5D
MAVLYKRVFSGVGIFSRCIISELSTSGFPRHVRTLYAQSALGIDNYVKSRESIHTQFANMMEKFKSKMQEYSEPESKNMIFTEDLKHMIHLADATPEDLNLIMKMMKRFNQQNKELRFGNYIFGPVVMRMYHFHDKPNDALQAFMDSDLEGFFDQLITYQILMDLLYKNGMYDNILEVFQIIKKRQIENAKYPKNVVVLTLAACYKLNTPESLKFALDLWKELQAVGHVPMRRAATFAAALALNHNSPHITLEIISGIKQQSYFTVRNIKAAALADIGRPEDSFPILRTVLQVDNPAEQKQTIAREVVQRVKEAVQRLENKNALYEFEQLEKLLTNQGHICDNTLDSQLCAEISSYDKKMNNMRSRDQRFLAASFNRQKATARGRSYARPGLEDMY